MKSRKLLARLGVFLNADEKTQGKEAIAIKGVLKALRQKEKKLQKKLLQEREIARRDTLQAQLDVIYAQRRKGLERVREIKSGAKKQDNSDAGSDNRTTGSREI